jgi:ribosome-binding factor A
MSGRDAAEFDTDDGSDPKRFHDRRRRTRPANGPRGPGRKSLQLCEQVKNALHGILAGCGDEVLQSLTVVSVLPAPNSGRLMVTVATPAPADVTDRSTVTDRLAAALGRVRTEVAATIHRRKAPELAFRVV